MNIFKREKENVNASMTKRVLSICIDFMVCNFFRCLLLQTVFLYRSKEILFKFYNDFNTLYPDFDISKAREFHIRYMVGSDAFREFLFLIFLCIIFGTIYNIINYLIFRDGTIGQKAMGLRVVKNKNDTYENMNIIQKICRSFLTSLPISVGFASILFMIINASLNIYKFIPHSGIVFTTISFFVKYSNIITLYVICIIFIIFWFNLFFLSNRFLPQDILTKTRVIDKKSVFVELNSKKEEIQGKDFVDNFEYVMKFLIDTNKKIFNFIVNVFKRKK